MDNSSSKSDLIKLKASRLVSARENAGFPKRSDALERFSLWSKDTYASHEMGRREIKEEAARKYAAAFGVTLSHLLALDELAKDDGLKSASPLKKTVPNASFPPRYHAFSEDESVPLLGQTSAGPNGRFILNGAEISRVFCPPGLEGVEGAYAVRVYGTSMEPRFKAGETVWLNPQEPVRFDDDVVAQIISAEDDVPESYIKQFKGQTSKALRLWQHNPDDGEDKNLEFESKKVFSVHKIVFHAMI